MATLKPNSKLLGVSFLYKLKSYLPGPLHVIHNPYPLQYAVNTSSILQNPNPLFYLSSLLPSPPAVFGFPSSSPDANGKRKWRAEKPETKARGRLLRHVGRPTAGRHLPECCRSWPNQGIARPGRIRLMMISSLCNAYTSSVMKNNGATTATHKPPNAMSS